MNCLLCRQAETVDGFTSVTFARGEMKVVVNHVPARVCSSCGETYVEEQVAVQLLREAEAISVAGILDGILDFNTTPSVK